jgi:hypothetical protein
MVGLVAQSSDLGTLIRKWEGNMAEYQNVFTQVQLRGPIHSGPTLARGSWARIGKGGYSRLLDWFGDAQIGPIYLGLTEPRPLSSASSRSKSSA